MISTFGRRGIGKLVNKNQKGFKIGFEFGVRFRKVNFDFLHFFEIKI